MHDRLKRFIVSLVIGLIAFIIPATATASSYQVLQCNNSGQVVAGTELLFDDPNAPANNASFCSEVNPRNASDKTIRIFSRVLCSFVSILNQVLGKVYCGIQFNLQKYIAIAITIYIAIFGVQILSGTAQMTTKELLTRFIKIGLVWAFVSNYNYGGNSIRDIMNLPTNPTETVSGVVPAYVYLDQLLYNAISGKFIEDNQELVGFFAILGFVFPPVFMLAAYWLWTTFLIFARTLIAFLMCITAIAFLITLSPIFFCLMLFKATYQFFETWLKFMISFSMQVLIVFAIVAMWLMAMANFVGFFDQLSRVLFISDGLTRAGPVVAKEDSFGVCPYRIVQGPASGAPLFGPNVRCDKANFNPFQVITSGENEGNLTESARRDLNDMIRLSNIAPPQTAGDCENDPNCAYLDETPSNAKQHRLHRLIYFTIYHLIILILVAYAFDALLKQAPYIAQQLAGPQYVPILGQGFGGLGYSKSLPGVARSRDDPGGTGSIAGNAVDGILNKSRNMPTQRKSPGS